MSNKLPDVSVIVPVLNGEKTIEGCLNSLIALDYPSEKVEIIIIDNGSTDKTNLIVSKYSFKCIIEKTKGLPYARNNGIRNSKNKIVVFIDSDCVASTSWLSELMKGFVSEDVGVVVGEVTTFPSHSQIENYTAIRKPRWQARSLAYPNSPWFLSGCAAFRKEVFEEIGNYDTNFSGVGCEDIDFSWRFYNKSTYKIEYQPRAVLLHKHRSTFRGLFNQYYRNGQGQYILSCKHPDTISWNFQREMDAYKDLFLSMLSLFNNKDTKLPPNTNVSNFNFKLFDLTRKIAERLGFSYAFLRRL